MRVTRLAGKQERCQGKRQGADSLGFISLLEARQRIFPLNPGQSCPIIKGRKQKSSYPERQNSMTSKKPLPVIHASDLIRLLQEAIAVVGDREVIAHDASDEAVDNNLRQWMPISFGYDEAKVDKTLPIEIRAYPKEWLRKQ
jgi:hypothetical protein